MAGVDLDLVELPSPNFDERLLPVSMIVLHYTGMPDAEGALDRLTSPEAKVSSHYLIDEDGTTYRLVDEARRAWHAGKSFWRGETDVNSASVGVEIVNPGHEFGYRPFPEPQVATVIALVGDIRSRWTIEDVNVVGHSDIAPDRKEDPGELFPWRRPCWPNSRPSHSPSSPRRRTGGRGWLTRRWWCDGWRMGWRSISTCRAAMRWRPSWRRASGRWRRCSSPMPTSARTGTRRRTR